MVFVDRGAVQPSEKGALTQPYLGGVTFELVHSHLKP
jgi:4-hydroxyphenylpyruvate dioxygenase